MAVGLHMYPAAGSHQCHSAMWISTFCSQQKLSAEAL